MEILGSAQKKCHTNYINAVINEMVYRNTTEN